MLAYPGAFSAAKVSMTPSHCHSELGAKPGEESVYDLPLMRDRQH
jgi:hypothetical protein